MSTAPQFRVMVVDDEPALRKLIGMELEYSLGCDVLRAQGGTEAIEILKTNKVDLVLTDLRMPDGDGLELLKALRSQGNTTTKAILMSGVSELDERQAIEHGAVALLAKPFRWDALVEIVKSHLPN